MQLKNHKQLLMVPLVGLLAQGAIADESKIDKKLAKEAPLFERIKLRGALRDDVSRDVIEQTPGEGYQPRVVQWWPKQGVDFIAEPKEQAAHLDDPSREHDGQGTGSLKTHEAPGQVVASARCVARRSSKAHLIGFRGLGAINDPWGDDLEKPFAPAVVLRLPDGRKRCFTRGSFSDADELNTW